MFAGGFKENNEDLVKIEGISFSGMEYVIGCFYKAGAPISHENLKNNLEAASLFQTSEVLKKCEEYMKTHIVESTCFQYLRLAETYSLKDVITKADTYILQNFLILRHSTEFKGLEKDGLIQYLRSDRLQIYDDESQVFHAAKDWLEHDSNRMPFAAEVMSNVRFEAISSAQLKSLIEDKIVSENTECKEKVQAAIDFHEEDNFKRPLVESCIIPRGKEGFIINQSYENGGNLHFKFLSLVNKKTWSSTSPMSIVEDSLVGVRLNNYMFLFGTKQESRNEGASSRRPITLRYDATFNTWMELEPVPQEVTAGPAVACFENDIFLIGGAHASGEDRDRHYYNSSMEDYHQITNKVWRYQINTNQWVEAKSLPVGLLHAAASGCPADGRIYVTGGLKQERHSRGEVADVYAYHLKAGIWIARPPMNNARAHHFMETVGQKLYVVGGKLRDRSTTVKTIEEYNTLQEQWSIVKAPEFIISSTRMGYVRGDYLYILNDAPVRLHHTASTSSATHSSGDNKTKQTFNVLKIDTSTITTLDQAEKQSEKERFAKAAERKSELARAIFQHHLMANNPSPFHGIQGFYHDSDDDDVYYDSDDY